MLNLHSMAIGRRAFELCNCCGRLSAISALPRMPQPDADLHTQLGFLDQLSGDTAAAAEEYHLALAANPFDATASGNTAIIQAQSGNLKQAASLWAAVFEHDPAQKVAGLNLAATGVPARRWRSCTPRTGTYTRFFSR